MAVIAGIFLVLHGMVHGLYAGQSWRLFELAPGMVWPDGSWSLSRLAGNEVVRPAAGLLLVLAALGFLAGGLGLAIGQGWWRPVIIGAAVFSGLLYVLLWDGRPIALDSQGGIGLLIDLAILAVVLIAA